MSRPYGIIASDIDNSNYLRLLKKVNNSVPDLEPLLVSITSYIKKSFPKLKPGTGDWYINYYYQDTKKVFFKIDTKQIKEYPDCIHISIYKGDMPYLGDFESHINEKPGGFFKHGKFPYQASVKKEADLKWARELLSKLYSIGLETL